jgi:hypothetical protein
MVFSISRISINRNFVLKSFLQFRSSENRVTINNTYCLNSVNSKPSLRPHLLILANLVEQTMKDLSVVRTQVLNRTSSNYRHRL